MYFLITESVHMYIKVIEYMSYNCFQKPKQLMVMWIYTTKTSNIYFIISFVDVLH